MIVLLVVLFLLFGGGLFTGGYGYGGRANGGLGGILVILLILWLLGVFH